jgi:hypothetical protein
MNQEIVDAIENKQMIEFFYDGGKRVVEPHCHGTTTKGNSGLRGYQVSGHSTSGKMGWKMFDLSKASSITILTTTFVTRIDYKRGDKGMLRIFGEI